MHPEFKPFFKLKIPRVVSRDDLPGDLARFFREHEGVGIESTPDYPVRIARLDELRHVGCADILVLEPCVSNDHPPDSWRLFAGIGIGYDSFLDNVVYVLESPVCERGSIILFGPDVAGPGGTGPDSIESSLVLARSFDEWLVNLERGGWVEYGAVPGSINKLPQVRQAELRCHYRSLNPGIAW